MTRRRRAGERGFTLIEMLFATALMVAILASLATVTAQWLPGWNYGVARVQRAELLAVGLERVVADLAAAAPVPPNGQTRQPLFEGSELAVTLVRSPVGPNTRPGLEIVRIAETRDDRGLVLVRSRARFVPLAAGATVPFADPVALIRAPYRVAFAYAGPDRVWRPAWREAVQLPSAVKITLRDAGSGQTLAVSTATLIHVDTPAACAAAQSPRDCATAPAAAPGTPAPAANQDL
jgi:general secretion pathway protein J